MSAIFAPSGNCFKFLCNCGWMRFVSDTEINFRCERPVVDATEDGCPLHYQQTHDGTSPGVPTVKRVDASGNDQSDPSTINLGSGPGVPCSSDAFYSADLIPAEDQVA